MLFLLARGGWSATWRWLFMHALTQSATTPRPQGGFVGSAPPRAHRRRPRTGPVPALVLRRPIATTDSPDRPPVAARAAVLAAQADLRGGRGWSCSDTRRSLSDTSGSSTSMVMTGGMALFFYSLAPGGSASAVSGREGGMGTGITVPAVVALVAAAHRARPSRWRVRTIYEITSGSRRRRGPARRRPISQRPPCLR